MVGFGDYEFAVTSAQVLFRFLDVVEYLPHDTADQHLEELRAELARSGGRPAGGQPR